MGVPGRWTRSGGKGSEGCSSLTLLPPRAALAGRAVRPHGLPALACKVLLLPEGEERKGQASENVGPAAPRVDVSPFLKMLKV